MEGLDRGFSLERRSGECSLRCLLKNTQRCGRVRGLINSQMTSYCTFWKRMFMLCGDEDMR